MRETIQLNSADSDFLVYLRGLSILIIIFGHVGGFWICNPYSKFLTVVVPIFFFISGAVNFYSYKNTLSLKKYYLKRTISLLVPYYAICLLSLGVYLIEQGNIPNFNFSKLLLWIQILPTNQIMPFPIGQVWFLHTLFFIILISPIYFYLLGKSISFLLVCCTFILFISGIELLNDISTYFYFAGHNLYKPIAHSLFFIFGGIYFSNHKYHSKKTGITLLVFFSLILVSLITILNVDLNFGKHNHPPDLYYLTVSTAGIIVCLLLKEKIISLVEKVSLISKFLIFCFQHTFALFLLHTLFIYIYEDIFDKSTWYELTLAYGISKFVFVLLFSCLTAPVFTYACNLLSRPIINMITPEVISPENRGIHY